MPKSPNLFPFFSLAKDLPARLEQCEPLGMSIVEYGTEDMLDIGHVGDALLIVEQDNPAENYSIYLDSAVYVLMLGDLPAHCKCLVVLPSNAPYGVVRDFKAAGAVPLLDFRTGLAPVETAALLSPDDFKLTSEDRARERHGFYGELLPVHVEALAAFKLYHAIRSCGPVSMVALSATGKFGNALAPHVIGVNIGVWTRIMTALCLDFISDEERGYLAKIESLEMRRMKGKGQILDDMVARCSFERDKVSQHPMAILASKLDAVRSCWEAVLEVGSPEPHAFDDELIESAIVELAEESGVDVVLNSVLDGEVPLEFAAPLDTIARKRYKRAQANQKLF